MSFFQKIGAVWQRIGLVQRALLVAIVLTFATVGGLLVHWARRPDMRMLYQQLAAEEASDITEKISEKGIAYELRNGGTSIFVPKEQVYQLRLDMAKEGLPVGKQGGYKIFDNEKIGVSPFVQNVNLKRALEEELAKSIQMIDGIVHSRVHIVSTEQSLFSSQALETTASVVLRLRPGYRLSGLNIAAITHLVSGSVEGLESGNVILIDSQGRLLSGESGQGVASGAGTVADYKERIERNLAEKVEDMLATVLGPGRAAVRVSAEIDMTSINTVTETPIKGLAKKEEIKEKSKTEGGTVPAEGETAVAGGEEKDSTIVTEYQHGKTVKQEVVLPGEIKSLTVAAVVDLSPADVNEAAGEGQAAKIMELADVEKLIRNALGLGDTDSLTVVDARFYRPAEPLIEEEPSSWPRYVAIARQASLGVMAICALLVLRIFSKASKKAASAASAAGRLPGTEGAAGLLPAEAASSEPLMLRKQISSALQNDPEQVKQLFSSWLEEGS